MAENFMVELAKDFPPDKYNLLFPSVTISDISKYQKVDKEILKISSKPGDKDVYDIKNDVKEGNSWVPQFALSKTALERIAHSAGIVLRSYNIRNDNPRIIEYETIGSLRKLDGSTIEMSKSITIDLDVVEEKLRFEILEKAKSGKLKHWTWNGEKNVEVAYAYGTPECQEAVETESKRALIRAKEFSGRKAESGSATRVIRSILGLKSAYTASELSKPFVVIRLSLKIDELMKDETTKRMLLESFIGAKSSIYGGSQTKELEAHPQPKKDVEDVSGEVINSVQKEEPAQLEEEVKAKALPEAKPINGETYKADCLKMGVAERLIEINSMLTMTGYKPKEGSRTPDKMTAEEQAGYMWYLRQMTFSKEAETPAPLPFPQ